MGSAALFQVAAAVVLLKGSAEIGQHPHGEQINTEQRLDARYHPHPADCLKDILVGLQAGDPVADVQLAEAEVEGRE